MMQRQVASMVEAVHCQDAELHDATKSASTQGFTDQNGAAGTRRHHKSGFFHRLKRFMQMEAMRKMIGGIRRKRHGHHKHGFM
jgi:hypothetical protein